MIKLKKRMSKYGSKSEYRATVSAGGSPSGLAANARSVGAPIFVFLAVVSVALRRVLVRGGEAAALVSRPAHAANSRPQRYLNVNPTGANLFLQAKKHVFLCV